MIVLTILCAMGAVCIAGGLLWSNRHEIDALNDDNKGGAHGRNE